MQVVIHFADAPAHGLQYDDESIDDHHPAGDPRGAQWTYMEVAAGWCSLFQLSVLLRASVRSRVRDVLLGKYVSLRTGWNVMLADSAGLDPENLMSQLAARGMAYHFASINRSTDKMVALFKDAYLAGGGDPEHLRVLRLYDGRAAFWQHQPIMPAANALATGLLAPRTRSLQDSFAPALMSSIRHTTTTYRSQRSRANDNLLRRRPQGHQ